MTWSTVVPLPPAALNPNHPVGSIGQRMAKADAEKRYKAACLPFFEKCPIRHAKFVRVSIVYYSVNNADFKAQPNKRGKITQKAKGDQPYYTRDFGNAWGAFKYGIDAIPEAGIVDGDDCRYMAGGTCDVWQTDLCRKAGIYEPGVKVTLEIFEELTLL